MPFVASFVHDICYDGRHRNKAYTLYVTQGFYKSYFFGTSICWCNNQRATLQTIWKTSNSLYYNSNDHSWQFSYINFRSISISTQIEIIRVTITRVSSGYYQTHRHQILS